MGKVWEKKNAGSLDPVVESYTVGQDWLLDGRLFGYEVEATVAHAKMLYSIGILSEKEADSIEKECSRLLAQFGNTIELKVSDEDIHSKLEHLLTAALGETGKKVHTGRSRNDQVLVVLRLYMKDRIAAVAGKTIGMVRKLAGLFAGEGKKVLPGYTHTKQAMLITAGTWAHAFAGSAFDNLAVLDSAYRLVDQNPLGAGSGFGVPIPLDREMTTDLLGFSRVQENVVYAQNSRGKFEAFVVDVLWQIQCDLSRMAADLIQYNMDELAYLVASDSITTGSSIMPQKRNLDPCELLRARGSVLLACSTQIKSILAGLTSGYHRDLQETKEPLMKAFETVESSLDVMTVVLGNIRFDEEAVKRLLTPGIFATDIAFKEVGKGVPFRDAYRIAAERIAEIEVNDQTIAASIDERVSPGSPKTLTMESLDMGIQAAEAVWGSRS